MVFEMAPASQGSLELLHPWGRHRALSRDDKLGILAVETELSDIPRYMSSDAALKAYLDGRCCVPLGPDKPSFGRQPDALQFTGQTLSRGFIFVAAEPVHEGFAFRFPTKSIWLKPRTKRRRHRLDVDGPNTADLSSKKRRIRADLITSRLSQPYSQPATHILNREGMESGDKRFLKMATTVDNAKRIAHLHGTSILRFSLMNRLRRRLGLWKSHEDGSKEDEDEDEDDDIDNDGMDTTAKPPWCPQSLQASSGGKYPKPSPASRADSTPKSSLSDRHLPAGLPAHTLDLLPGPRLSNPAALPLPSADLAATKERTSARIQPIRSPELRPIAHYEELEEDGFAFLHADDESAGDVPEDSEDVYSDFGVIFGASPTAEGEDHTYEEYLDELDGISWVTR